MQTFIKIINMLKISNNEKNIKLLTLLIKIYSQIECNKRYNKYDGQYNSLDTYSSITHTANMIHSLINSNELCCDLIKYINPKNNIDFYRDFDYLNVFYQLKYYIEYCIEDIIKNNKTYIDMNSILKTLILSTELNEIENMYDT